MSTNGVSTTSPDTLVFDFSGAQELAGALGSAADELTSDQLALRRLLDEATAVLHADRTGALVPLASARRGLERLAADLTRRIGLVAQTQRRLDLIDELSRVLLTAASWADDGEREKLRANRRRVLMTMVDGDADHVDRLERALAAGHDAATAFGIVAAELRLEVRVDALMEAFGIDEAAALELIARVDEAMVELLALGYGEDDAVAALAIIENFGLDLQIAVDHAEANGLDLQGALGQMLTARGLGVTLDEYGALAGLVDHFSVFDNAMGGSRDQRVSAHDLRYVVAHPREFTPSQVVAAGAILREPNLRHRLDTANDNTELFGGAGFGSTEPGDGLIADVDLQAFMLKAQLHTILGDYADEIDVANDPSGVVDGYRSRNDFQRFIADNPDLPESVLAAAGVALEAGWFDESWWQEHKDEVAMGAALLAAGVVVVATGGAASMVLVVGVGALAAGATTVTVNLATGAPMLDDVFMNAVKGGFIAAGVHGVSAGVAAYGTATTSVARVAAVSGATSGAADVVAGGGVDLLIDERYEASVHDVANEISTIAGAADLAHGLGEWATRRSATFETVDDQLAALSDSVSRQRQLRHLKDSPLHEYGGYFDDMADAQRVLDAVHDGSADVLGITTGNDLLVRYDDVVGVHASARPELAVDTTTFIVKGTAKPSVVPTRPGRTE